MNTDLLLTLANRLERDVPEGKWNFSFFGEEQECGFVGCAIGWACHWPEFPIHMDATGCGFLSPCSDASGLHDFDAIAEVFGITEPEAAVLFDADGHYEVRDQDVTPSMVAAAIRKFVGAQPMPEISIQPREAVEVSR